MRLPGTTVEVRGRQVAQFVAGIALAAALIGWMLPAFAQTSWGDIWAVLREVPPHHALGLQVLMVAGLYGYTFVLTGSLPGLTHGRALVLNLCGSSVSKLLPAGGALGLAATYTICRSWGFTRRAVSTSALVSGVWNVLTRILLPVVAILVLLAGAEDLPRTLTDLATAGAATGSALVAAFVGMMVSERVAQAIGRGLDRALRPLLRRRPATASMSLEELVRDLRARVVVVVRDAWWSMSLGMLVFFGLYYVLFVLVMEQTGVDLPLDELFAAYAIGRLLTAVGVTPGGIGVTETATVVALVGWGADPAGASAGVILFSLVTYLMEIPLGAVGWLLWSLSTKTPPPEAGSDEVVVSRRAGGPDGRGPRRRAGRPGRPARTDAPSPAPPPRR
ncbi:lysylphosphatidylglycerol synthase transmembrane domain-containing protein [Phycicoccus avicenniae]|uniref:lysylphosphatidylglycerol synthase transmembrane domain-containing protein n=1 Tax=Phycicoccus avicenniae TaxID=2828860 RepID=UPI0020137183|nr:lysylphosphatidylglycerol synthase transmembrane domain-containing protein [Phycicoccus avicenniae]